MQNGHKNHKSPPSILSQDNKANSVPCGTINSIWGRVSHRDNSEITRIQLEVRLKVLTHQHCAAARQTNLVCWNIPIPIAFDHNGTLENRITVLSKSVVQKCLPPGR